MLTVEFDVRFSGSWEYVNFFSGDTCFVMSQPNYLIAYEWVDRRIEASYVKLDELIVFLITNEIEPVDDLGKIAS